MKYKNKAEAVYKSKKATAEDRRLLLSYAFSNATLNEGKLKPNYIVAFEFLADWMPRLNKSFEQRKIAQNERKTDDFASVCPEMLRLLNEIRTYFRENPDADF